MLLFGSAQHIGLSAIFCLGVEIEGLRLQNIKGTQHWLYGLIGGQDFVLDFCRSRYVFTIFSLNLLLKTPTIVSIFTIKTPLHMLFHQNNYEYF